MAEAGMDNHVVLSGSLLRPAQLRYSPAGVPIARFWLEHGSAQAEGERSRSVRFRIEVRAVGGALCRGLDGLEPGQPLRIRGHLARSDQRGEPGRLVIVAEGLELS